MLFFFLLLKGQRNYIITTQPKLGYDKGKLKSEDCRKRGNLKFKMVFNNEITINKNLA